MASSGRLKDGRFAKCNTFAKGYGTPHDRLQGDETELKVWCVNAEYLMMRVRRELAEARLGLKIVSFDSIMT